MKMNQASLTELKRSAFSLVELMIAMAIIILMLSIMSQAFVIATTVMQGLKDAAEMQMLARPVINILQRDLAAQHFEGTKKLSDADFWDNGPPRQGYFMAWQEFPHDVDEKLLEKDSFSLISGFPYPILSANQIKTLNSNIFTVAHPGYESKSLDKVQFRKSGGIANHQLSFTARLPGRSPEEFFQAKFPRGVNIPPFGAYNLPPNYPPNNFLFFNSASTPSVLKDGNYKRFENDPSLIHSYWAEVAYFLGPYGPNQGVVPNASLTQLTGLAKPQPTGTTGGSNPQNLYTLYRQQKLILPELSGVQNTSITGLPVNYNASLPPVKITVPSNQQPFQPIPNISIGYDDLKKAVAEYSFWPQLADTITPPIAPNTQQVTTMNFNTTRDLTIPWKRMGYHDMGHMGFPMHNGNSNTYPMFPEFTGSNSDNLEYTDVLATNVISFDIRFLTDDRMEFEDLYTILNQYDAITSSQPYKNHQGFWNYPSNISSLLPVKAGNYNLVGLPVAWNAFQNPFRAVFDTWTTSQGSSATQSSGLAFPKYDMGNMDSGKWQPSILGLPDNNMMLNFPELSKLPGIIPVWNTSRQTGLRIKAIQISLRLWDSKANVARQYVLVQRL